MGAHMITIKEIAKLAGVSFSTVSKALNNSPLVKEDTKRHILEIAEQFGYRTNLLAKQLVTGKSRMIGLIWQDVDNPVYSQLAMKLYQLFHQEHYEMVMTVSSPSEATDLFQQLRVDGLIYWGDVEQDTEFVAKRLPELKTPILLVGNNATTSFPSLQIDRRSGIYEAVRFLKDKGHNRIGFIGDSQEVKLRGYKDALLDFGLAYSPDFILPSDLTWESGYRAVMQADWNEVKPSAYIGCNNLVTRGALRAFMEKGIQVPQQMSLIGYDELPEMAYAEVPLTSVGPSLEEVAMSSVEMMIELLQEGHLDESRIIMPLLHERKSVRSISMNC
jgi:LacI family transcriptional regulator